MSRQPPGEDVSRRQLIRSVGAGVTALAAGCAGWVESGSPSGYQMPQNNTEMNSRTLSEHYESVVNVRDAGADPDGETSITELLEEEAADDTALLFPDGQYALEPVELEEISNLGIVSAEDASPALVPAVPAREIEGPWIGLSQMSDLLFEGIDLDFSEPEYAGPVSVSGSGDFVVRNISVEGPYDVDGYGFRFAVNSAEHSALVANVSASGIDEDGVDTTGMYVERQHAGEITFRDCRLESFSNNGLYASSPGGKEYSDPSGVGDGAVHVIGGTYKNNNISNVRIGSTGATVRNTTVIVDETPPEHPAGLNVRGIRLRGQRDQIVDNCEVVYASDAGGGDGAIVIHQDNGRATVKNTQIQMDRDEMNAIRVNEPADETRESGPTDPVFENVKVTGTAEEQEAVRIVGRDETEFRGCCIHQSGTRRDGISLRGSENCSISDTTVAVTGDPLVVVRSAITQDDTTFVSDDDPSGLEGQCE